VFLKGTTFRTKALVQLSKVKYGKTISYSELAGLSGNKKAIRAAASACANNPVPIIIPCQRVIAKDGSLGGFGGGLNMKRKMLEMEKAL
jgi:methylated-DNA-[protein]-cysteine S-methyltransferase